MTAALAKTSAKTLVRLGKAAQADLADDVNEATDEAVASTSRKRSTLKRAALMLLLFRIGTGLGDKLRKTIQQHRERARDAAIGRLKTEIAAAGVAGMSLVHWGNGSERYSEDDAQGAVAGAALATLWRGLVVYQAMKALRQEDAPSSAIADTRGLMKARVRQTSITEMAQAYNDEHTRALDDAIEYDRKYRDGEFAEEATRLEREWSAFADACHKCWPHDGERVGLGEMFSGGDEPGYVHVNCQCIEIIVPALASDSKAA